VTLVGFSEAVSIVTVSVSFAAVVVAAIGFRQAQRAASAAERAASVAESTLQLERQAQEGLASLRPLAVHSDGREPGNLEVRNFGTAAAVDVAAFAIMPDGSSWRADTPGVARSEHTYINGWTSIDQFSELGQPPSHAEEDVWVGLVWDDGSRYRREEGEEGWMRFLPWRLVSLTDRPAIPRRRIGSQVALSRSD
jgi:type II secretory pathway pseudopilin PulG